jgi:uncharacterized protein YjgD (DUF1641 family)
MAQIVEVMGVGNVEFPDGMSQADIANALKKLPQTNAPQKFTPTPENRGNVINSDVPTVVGEKPNAINAQPVEKPRTAMDYVKAAYEVPTALVSGAVAQPVGQAYGAIKNAISPEFGTQKGIEQGENAGGALANALTYKPTSPVSQGALETIGSAMEAAKLPAYTPVIGELPSFAKAAQATKPIIQEVVAPAAKNIANALREEGGMVKEAVMPTINKAVETAKPAVEKLTESLRREPSIIETAPTAKELEIQSKALFDKARQSNVVFKPEQFAQKMTDVGSELRVEGYSPAAYPKITAVLSELQDKTRPKDFTELTALRKIIAGAQASPDATERRLAGILKNQFDEYISNAPESAISAGTKEGVEAWKQARNTWSKLSKSEVFDEMLYKAKLDKSKFTQSGEENSLAMQLRKLSENPRKMRLFTPAEQAEIRKAAQGGTTQNMLRFFGKFSPHGYISAMGGAALALSHPAIGIPLELGAIGSRYAATKIRKNDVNKLAALMRAGAK